MIKNKPWKKWRTRKVTFVGVLFIWLLLLALDLIGVEINEIIIENLFDKGAWVITTGTLLVLREPRKKESEEE